MEMPVLEPYPGRELRWIADAYEQAQRVRVEAGERIRAVIQGRDDSWIIDADAWGDPDPLLVRIRDGETDGPVPLLGRTFRRHWVEERELHRAMLDSIRYHPAWPWLGRVRGVGPTLACKLVGRLDVTKADTPSSFWAYCGLATVPGAEYRCESCGLIKAFPANFRVKGAHHRLGSRRRCNGELVRTRGPDDGVRVAQPEPGRGEKASYDRYAKKVCYLIGVSFLKARGAYEAHYRAERARLDVDRKGWPDGRKHFAALRKTEKLFLAHLWLVWRKALDLPVTEPYANVVQGRGGQPRPEEMLD